MKYLVEGTDLTSVANAIRTKGGTSADLSFPDGFVTAVEDISTGGGAVSIEDVPNATGTTAVIDGTDASHIVADYDLSETALGSDGSVDLSEAIEALTTYSNEVTEASDTTLSAAVTTLAAGYGGGGSSNIVTGTFTGTTTGAAMTISVPYTGSGYPVSVVIYPSDGPYNTDSTIYSTVQRYVVIMWHMVKTYPSVTPAYTASGTADYGTVLAIYKGSTSDATATTSNRTNENTRVYSTNTAADSWSNSCRFNSATEMSVYIASDSYGFMANIPYTYHIIYSL